MNIRFLLCISLLLLFSSPLFSQYQKLTEFSENRGEYINQLKTFMTSSKRKKLEEVFELYQSKFQSFSEEEFKSIREVSNQMLVQKMSASPYFSDYLKCLSVVKNSEEGAAKFEEWQQVLNQMLGDIKNRKLNPFKKFLSFSIGFFEKGALRSSKSGTNWLAQADDYKIIYEDGVAAIKYDKLNLIAARKKDSISIEGTAGIFYPSKLEWHGKGGKVYWDRFEELKDVYAELGEYKIEVKKSLYNVPKAKFYHPEFFPNGPIEGSFGDKISAKNKATGGSYPRFESKDSILSISNIGAGIQYTGGFRFKGKTVYGFGSKDHKAKITLFKDSTTPVFKAASELFVIRKDEQISGERVETVMFFDQDSIYHPSLNFKFDIANQIIKVNRGKRGSDRNPFYNSFNQMNIDTDRIDWFVQKDSMVIGSVLPGGIGKGNTQVSFESLEYFDEGDYRRIQSIADYNPIAALKVISEKKGTKTLDANFLAKQMNPRFSVSSIQSLLYDLVAQGFVNYDSDKQIVEVKDKVLHYADASREKVDYDVLRIVSETKKANAVFNLKT
ncbi:MAG TPA: hypothetical protein ENK52_01905, partial [Saprospiraceae bacterium]|nr:hypothetical protein [Saprospiraceae bacterium]